MENISTEDSSVDIETVSVIEDFTNEVSLGQEAVKKKIQENGLLLYDIVRVKLRKMNVMEMCLEEVNNGHQIVKDELDKLVSRDKELGIRINIGKLYRQESNQQSMIVKNIIKKRNKEKEESFAYECMTELLEHPVIGTFIIEKWKRSNTLYTLQTRMYMIFLLLFTLFIILPVHNRRYFMDKCKLNFSQIHEMCDHFQEKLTLLDKGCTDPIDAQSFFESNYTLVFIGICFICLINIIHQIKKYIQKIRDYKSWNHYPAIPNLIKIISLIIFILITSVAIYVVRSSFAICPKPFLMEWFNVFSLIEAPFLVVTVYQLIKEIPFLVLAITSPYYQMDSQTYMEWFSIFSAFLAMGCKDTNTANPYASGIISLGFYFAWMLFIFKYGQSKFTLSGNFIFLYWNILTKLYPYLLIILWTIMGFSISLSMLEHQIPKNEYASDNFFSVFMTTMTKSMGEFDYREEFFPTFKDHTVLMGFGIIFLIMIIICTTLLMFNLLISNIIRDHQSMMREVYVNKFCNMACYSFCLENFIFKMWPLNIITRLEILPYRKLMELPKDHEVFICTSRLCNFCSSTHLKPYHNDMAKNLESILQMGERSI